jgi:hypothetical protein
MLIFLPYYNKIFSFRQSCFCLGVSIRSYWLIFGRKNWEICELKKRPEGTIIYGSSIIGVWGETLKCRKEEYL